MSEPIKAVILAAGRGTRLGSLTDDLPKPMLPLAGKPALENIILRIKCAGISDFIVVVKYRAEKIKEYFGDGSALGVRISYVPQGQHYGTAAALLAAKSQADGSPILMTYGDVITSEVNYSNAISLFSENRCMGVATINQVPDGYAGSSVSIGHHDRILRVIEKPAEGLARIHWNCAGIFVFQPSIFDYLGNLRPSERGEYDIADAMNDMTADDQVLLSCQLQGFWRDMGTLEGIADAERMLLENPIQQSC